MLEQNRHRQEAKVQSHPSEVIGHTSALLRDLKNKLDTYMVNVQGHDILVYPGVFRPTTETHLLTKYIIASATQRVLDITTGSGAAAVIAGKQGASGIAVDINPHAVKNAEENFHRHGVAMRGLQSNLYANLPKEQFDLILCNPPYYEGNPREPIEYAIYGGRKFIKEFFGGMKPFLAPEGKALVTYAEWAGDVDYFDNTIREEELKFSVIGRQKSSDGLRIYRLYEVTH